MRHAVRLTLAALVPALVLATAGSARGVAGPDLGTATTLEVGNVRYVTTGAGPNTVLEARTRGSAARRATFAGRWGIPRTTLADGVGGLSHDRRVLVLAESTHPNQVLRSRTRFLVVDTRRLAATRTIALRGDFGFDALSPRGRTLYLIQHLPGGNFNDYRVRAYDLRTGRLVPGVVADRREPAEQMSGYPAGRIATSNGRWVFTLYANPEAEAFVHALDSVSRQAFCIDLPWKWEGTMEPMQTATLKLTRGETRLVVVGLGGLGPRFVVNTRTHSLVQPVPES